MKKINDFAKALGRLGGMRRATRLTPAQRSQIASLGGRARAQSLEFAKRIETNFRYAEAVRELRNAGKRMR